MKPTPSRATCPALLIVVMLTFSRPSPAVNVDPISVGRWAWDEVSTVAVTNNYAYIVSGGLRILDVTDARNPKEVGTYETPYPLKAAVAFPYVCLLDDWLGLVIIDITRPTAPREVGRCYTAGKAKDIAVQGTLACVVSEGEWWNGAGTLELYDFSNPAQPFLIASYRTACRPTSLALRGSHAVIAGTWLNSLDNGYLEVVDFGTPAYPLRTASLQLPGRAEAIAWCGDYAYLLSDRPSLTIYDLTTPSNPRELAWIFA